MQVQQAILTFTDAERPLGERLLKLAVEIDRIEGYSEPHSVIIARFSEKLGATMGLHGSDLTSLKFAALIHDIGERQTKRNYLLRPDALTWEERLDLWRHPILGEQASAELRLPRHTQLMIRWHHEWWNGLGYPDGLSGDAIPLGARILRAVDSYYALISTRPYRQRFELVDAEQIIADLAGIEFDPMVVKVLLTALQEERKARTPEFWAPAEPLQNLFEPPLAVAEPEPLLLETEDPTPAGFFDESPKPFPEQGYFPSALPRSRPPAQAPAPIHEDPGWDPAADDPLELPDPQLINQRQADFPDDIESVAPQPPAPPVPPMIDRPLPTIDPESSMLWPKPTPKPDEEP